MIVIHLIKKFPAFVESVGSLPFPEIPVVGTCLQQITSVHVFLKIPLVSFE
jgi:hypothetical protein